MTISAHSLSNGDRVQEPTATPRDAKGVADRAQLDLETCRRELRAAIEWFKRMRDGWRRPPSTGDSQVEPAPGGVDRQSGAGRPHVETPVAKAPAPEAPPRASCVDNVGERRRTTAIEPAKAPRRGVAAWFKQALSRLTAGVWNNPLAAAVAPIAAYAVVGALIHHVMRQLRS